MKITFLDYFRKEASGDYVLGFAWQGGLIVLLIITVLIILYWEKQGTQHPYPSPSHPPHFSNIINNLNFARAFYKILFYLR
jgi:hypothetical protein